MEAGTSVTVEARKEVTSFFNWITRCKPDRIYYWSRAAYEYI